MSSSCLKGFVEEVLAEAVYCRACGDPTYDDSDTCELHKDEPTKLELLPGSLKIGPEHGKTVYSRPLAPISGGPRVRGLRGF